MPEQTMLRVGDPQRVGAYRVLRRIAEGGQGVVYLAESPGGEQVALKLLRAAWLADPAARDRLVKEVAAARNVAPFCTAQPIEADVEGEPPFIVSEFVDGPSLNEHVRTQGPLAGTALDRLAIGTATALAAIHRARITHRDFKPGNVILGPDGPRVIDFGIARDLTNVSTSTAAIMGTPPFMAPEQMQGEAVGPPADMYAWGATLLFAATGHPPFEAPSLVALMYRVLHDEPDLSALTGSLRTAVARCLAKDPGVRPSAEEVLLGLLGQERPEAAPSSGGDAATVLAVGARRATGAPSPIGGLPLAAPPVAPSAGPPAGAPVAPPVGAPVAPPVGAPFGREDTNTRATQFFPAPAAPTAGPLAAPTAGPPAAPPTSPPMPPPTSPGAAAPMPTSPGEAGTMRMLLPRPATRRRAGIAAGAGAALLGAAVFGHFALAPETAGPSAGARPTSSAAGAPAPGAPSSGAAAPAASSSGAAAPAASATGVGPSGASGTGGTSSGPPSAPAGGGAGNGAATVAPAAAPVTAAPVTVTQKAAASTVAAAPTPAPATTSKPPANTVPAGWSGTWSGDASQQNGVVSAFHVTIRLTAGSSAGSFSLDIGCSGTVTVARPYPTATVLHLNQRLNGNQVGCAEAGYVTLRRTGAGVAAFSWTDSTGGTSAEGTVRRSGGGSAT